MQRRIERTESCVNRRTKLFQQTKLKKDMSKLIAPHIFFLFWKRERFLKAPSKIYISTPSQ